MTGFAGEPPGDGAGRGAVHAQTLEVIAQGGLNQGARTDKVVAPGLGVEGAAGECPEEGAFDNFDDDMDAAVVVPEVLDDEKVDHRAGFGSGDAPRDGLIEFPGAVVPSDFQGEVGPDDVFVEVVESLEFDGSNGEGRGGVPEAEDDSEDGEEGMKRGPSAGQLTNNEYARASWCERGCFRRHR